MSTRQDRINVFYDTQDWIATDPDLSASVDKAKLKTTVFFEDDYPLYDASPLAKNQVVVTMDRSFQAAIRLHRENPSEKIAVMNFANAFHAGGGVKNGSSAQEEALCRTSTLYPLIYRRSLRDTYYKHHEELNTPKASDALIYTEGVVICKTDTDFPERLPKEEWVTVDVITVAAPDLRQSSNIHADLVDGGASMNDAELFGYHVKRAIHILTCAASKGAKILVLGAFGCGAFQNNPDVVANAYKTAIKSFPHVFTKIEFAVFCPPGQTANFEAFRKAFNSGFDASKNRLLTSYINIFKCSISDESLQYAIQNKFVVDTVVTVLSRDDIDLRNYSRILNEVGIDYKFDSMCSADVSHLEEKYILALVVGAVRADHWSDNALSLFIENGSLIKWLERLKELDETRLQ